MLAQTLPVASCFSKAASSYVGAARLQRQVAYQALARLTDDSPELGHLLDVGCGPGWLHPELLGKAKQLTAVDFSAGMLSQAKQQALPVQYILADAAAMPLAANSIDSIFSSLMLQWCPAPAQVLTEMARVLKPGGHFVITTLVAGTLSELAQAFSAVDGHAHIHDFTTAQELAAALADTPLAFRLEAKCYPLTYPDIFALARELKALGANHLALRPRQGLTGKGYWQKVAAAYPMAASQQLVASYQVLQISGYKAQ